MIVDGKTRIGVDIGGTFTDVVMMTNDAPLVRVKVPSTPADPTEGFLAGIDALRVDLSEAALISHGTTIATNAVLTGSGAATALITTQGFRDTLLMRRTNRRDQFNLWWQPPEPIVERRLILEAPERVDARGNVVLSLDVEVARGLARRVRDLEVDAVAVVFLHSFVNPEHERLMATVLGEECDDLFVCTSHEVLAEILEYERTSTTVINAYVGPSVRGYLARAEDRLHERAYAGDLLISSSSGGMMTTELAAAQPAKTMMSGPAAGVMAAREVAASAGFDKVISFEMGGTSLDIGLVEDGEVRRGQEWNVAFETPVRLPVVDIASIGAGGGTIAWIDRGGALRSGPRSAGADPGPACYGRGGTEPTNTDAQLVLGRLNPARFLGGQMEVDLGLAIRALDVGIARPLKQADAKEAAAGVLTVAEHNMVEALRLATVHRGRDPRDFVLLAGGGAGPLFAPAVARIANVPKVIVPPWPGLASAVGLLVMDIRHDSSRSLLVPLSEVSQADIEGALNELRSTVIDRMEGEGFSPEALVAEYEAELRYFGTSQGIVVPLGSDVPTAEELRDRFTDLHEREFGYVVPQEVAPVELATIRVAAVARVDRLELTAEPLGDSSPIDAQIGTRPVWFPEVGFSDALVYERALLSPGTSFSGPAVVEQSDSTTVLFPGMTAEVDAYRNLVIDVGR